MPANKPNFALLFLSLPIQGTFFSEQFFKHSEDHCNTSKKVKCFSEVFNFQYDKAGIAQKYTDRSNNIYY